MEYCPYYCEENVWRLVSGPGFARARAWALFVFGRHGRAAVFRQKAGHGPLGLVLWDYHVVALAEGREGAIVLDFDSALGFETPADEWVRRSLLPPAGSPAAVLESMAGCEPLVRPVPAAEFARRFWSDRSHMRAPDGSWLAPPPAWAHPGSPAASPPENGLVLSRLIDPASADPGPLLDARGLLRFAAGPGRARIPDTGH